MDPRRRDSLFGLSSSVFMPRLVHAAPRAKTILLAPGLFGYSKIGTQSYFNGLQQYFDPGCTFHSYAEAPLGSIEKRAGQLLKALEGLKPPSTLLRIAWEGWTLAV
jgi:hypothetical protein